MPWYQQQLSVFTPSITSASPPEPLFSLLTNIPHVTFPICLKSDSLTGVSVGNLGNSQRTVTSTVETDGKNRDLEISLGYYDLAQSLGTRSSGRTDMLYLSLSMRLSSNAVNQFGKSMFCSGWPKNHTIILVSKLDKQLWPLLFRCRDPYPWKPNLWWETEQNALIAAGFAASGVTVSSQLLKDCPCSIMPCPSCKAYGNPVPLWQTRFAAHLEPSHGVYFIRGDKAYLSLPPFW